MDTFKLTKNGLVVLEGELTDRLVLTLGGVVKFDSGPIVQPPPPPEYPPIDYDDPRYDVDPRHILGVPGVWAVFPNGLPANWDWDAWMAATGRPDPRGKPSEPGPDMTGSDLNSGARRQNFHPADHPLNYTFDVPQGPSRRVEINVRGAAGHYFNGGWMQVSGYERVYFSVSSARARGQLIQILPPGRHSVMVTVDRAGPCFVDAKVS